MNKPKVCPFCREPFIEGLVEPSVIAVRYGLDEKYDNKREHSEGYHCICRNSECKNIFLIFDDKIFYWIGVWRAVDKILRLVQEKVIFT